MTKKEFKKYKKQYGKKITNWPLYKQKEAITYLSEKYEKRSEVWLIITIIFGVIAIGTQSVCLIAKIFTILR